ncbi:DUF4192 domain-containing protein [Bifidobacterium platyrrhinorum]|uniref:DUF4192 domain-containing protein n=1 Tax=Bifidobacterium platyrrhinorum TaxID=2661628 RepID=A0A6L9SPM8_9BIFI|nr:DUF4192 domain-containing protein [Bifidobacterium platyrrhinorum]NEG54476.1 DUF4192 domain-containing protein [Bifidobacterium platyrrhinorum]
MACNEGTSYDGATARDRAGTGPPSGPRGRRRRARHAGGVRSDRAGDCRAYLDGIDELDPAVVADMVRRLRDDRRAHGPAAANADWMDGPLDEWLGHLERGVVDLGEETLAALAVGMHEVLSMRDALILSMILDGDVCGRDTLMDVLSRPRTAEVSALVRDLLVKAFSDADLPDADRCRTGMVMLAAMTCLMPEGMAAQPFAAIAYVLWWLGDARAPAYALRSLAADERCTLAAIVLRAAERGLGPACAYPEAQ